MEPNTKNPESEKQLSTLTSETPKLTLAVIDDERRWLKVFARMFRNSAYDVDTFDDPQQFLAIIRKHPDKYAGIICDINMPHMDGYQVFEAVKNDQASRNIPFVIVSGALTQNNNVCKIQGVPYISKLDDDLRSKIFQELIDVIENWPRIKAYLQSQRIADDKIDFFCQFFINYHKYFHEILTFINKMEAACVNCDHQAMIDISNACTAYMAELQDTCMQLIAIMQDGPEATAFVRQVCERGRTSINMIQTFQMLLSEEPSTRAEFRSFLKECRESLEKIISGTEKGYNLRAAE